MAKNQPKTLIMNHTFPTDANPAAVAQLQVTPELIASISETTKVEHAPHTIGEISLAGADDEELSCLAQGCRQRASMYALLARVYRVEVNGEFLRQLQVARYAANTGNEDVDEGYRMVVQSLCGTWEHSLLELAKDYVRAFIGFNGDHASAAYPYESVYLSEKHLLMQDQRDEVLSCYRTAGLDKDGEWHESEDHVALEFEYMQTLAQRYATLDFYRGFARVTRGWLACEMELFSELGGAAPTGLQGQTT